MSDKKFDELEPQTAEAGSGELETSDGMSTQAKLEKLKNDNKDNKSWYDVKCGVCGRRCCSPCTADGDISRCAQTRFRECSTCGHASSSHYRVSH